MPRCPPAVHSHQWSVAALSYSRSSSGEGCSSSTAVLPAPGRTDGICLMTSFASHYNVFQGVKAFLFPSLLRNENQLHRSKKMTSLTCINKHTAFKLMITIYFSYFINSFICIYTSIIDYLDYHSLVHYCFKAQS